MWCKYSTSVAFFFVVYFNLLHLQIWIQIIKLFVRKSFDGIACKITSSSWFHCLNVESQYIIHSYDVLVWAAAQLRCVVTPATFLHLTQHAEFFFNIRKLNILPMCHFYVLWFVWVTHTFITVLFTPLARTKTTTDFSSLTATQCAGTHILW